jgi:hypothetical protein
VPVIAAAGADRDRDFARGPPGGGPITDGQVGRPGAVTTEVNQDRWPRTRDDRRRPTSSKKESVTDRDELGTQA